MRAAKARATNGKQMKVCLEWVWPLQDGRCALITHQFSHSMAAASSLPFIHELFGSFALGRSLPSLWFVWVGSLPLLRSSAAAAATNPQQAHNPKPKEKKS